MHNYLTSSGALVWQRSILIFIFLLAAFTSYGQNQTAKVTPKSSIYYLEYLPSDYATSTASYPVVFFMHGIGERGNNLGDLARVTTHGPPKHVKNGTQFPFILISPQCKTNLAWPAWYIDEVVEHVKSTLRIDNRRIYITGLSLGGGGAWTYTQTYPGKVAALAPVCGGFNATKAACNLSSANIPVWAFHGDKDTVVPMSRSRSMVDAINDCVPPPSPLAELTIYPGVRHNAWDNAYRTDNSLHTPNVYQWLMQWTNGGVSVNAGTDINLNLPTASTNILGTASTETGAITSYTWLQVSGPPVTLTHVAAPSLSLTNLIEGVYTFRLTATNSAGESDSDDVKVTVLKINLSPVANAGNDLTLTLPTNTINIVGTGSDTDGTIASYTWAKISGPIATLTGTTTTTLRLTDLLQGTYALRLTVKDNKGATHSDDVVLTVNAASINQLPIANAGNDVTINLPTTTASIIGTGSDIDGTIASYLWEKVSGPSVNINTPTSPGLSLSQLVSGSYIFKLIVTDNKGGKGADQVNVTVVASNQVPLANAGLDITLTLPTKKTSIQGSGSDADGSIANYAWSQISGPNTAALTNATSNTVTADGLITGTYVFRLTVTDNRGATGFDDVTVTVNALITNVAPSVSAGIDRTMSLPLNSIVIEGGATDTDGIITLLQWEKVSGAAAILTNANMATLTVNNLVAGTYIFRLTATDDDGATSSDEVTVTVMPDEVNVAPIANAGQDVGLTLPLNSTTLVGSGTDADGSIVSYSWQKTSGPGPALSVASTTLVLSGLTAGIYTFTFTVTDAKGASDSDDVSVTVQNSNIPPVANAGADITINSVSVIIRGSATDKDGTIVAFLWQQRSGPNTVTLANENTNSLQISGLITGTYTFRFTVTDNNGAKHSDDIKVIVNSINQAPELNVDGDKTISLPTNTVNFTSSAIDSDGEIISYQWTQVSGPAATLDNATTPTLTVTVSASDVYLFKIEVTDDDGAKNFEEVRLTVNVSSTNNTPIATVTKTEPITLPVNMLTISGAGTDEDGTIVSYRWTKVSGPQVTILNDTLPILSLSNLVEGTYVFRLTVADNESLTAYAETTITVLPATVNQAPIASAGEDQTLILPVSGTTLTGSASDADGTVLSYVWTKVQGPPAALANATNAVLTIPSLVAGVYKFRLTVTDDDGATDTDDVLIDVKPAGTNAKPLANAGPDRTIHLPLNTINLVGSGSDGDGVISTYTWIKVSGPQALAVNNNAATLSLSGLTEGTYVYRLEVRDDDGETDTDDVLLHVLAANVNQVPQVSIDGNKNIYLPENTALLIGAASDPDGTIISYRWEKIAGPTVTLINDTFSALTLKDLIEATYQFRLTVIDDDDASSFSDFTLVVNSATANRPPVANAGEDLTINLPQNSTAITGIGADAETTELTYAWEKIAGPALTISHQNSATLALSGMEEGLYKFSFTVTDKEGQTAVDFIEITVLPERINTPPTVNAGKDVTLVLPENATSLSGAASDDGLIQTILWSKIEGPEVSLADASTNTLMLNGLKEGIYIFRYSVTDNGGLSAFDEVMVTIFPEPQINEPPIVDAGKDIVIQLPEDSLTISAEANSPEGLIVSYRWIQIEGDPIIIQNDSSEVLHLNQMPPGEYVFQITVTDSWGNEASDEVEILVIEEEPAVRPHNTFSPNGDDIDQTWKIANAFLLDECEIVIFNRGGLTVYQSKGYNNEWDGLYKGSPLEEGVYFYIIRCDRGISKTGSIMLIR